MIKHKLKGDYIMQELVINILLTVVIIMAVILLLFVGNRKDGMTKKQRIMMVPN